MNDFLQQQPNGSNRFVSDRAFRTALERTLEAEMFDRVTPMFHEMGERAIEELPRLAERAESNPPRLVNYDAWGGRVDRLQVEPAWLELVKIGLESGLVSIPYGSDAGPHSRIVQFALEHLFIPVSATANCPIAMTDAAVKVLLSQDELLAQKYVPRLTAHKDAWTSGQWMTEREGGSDVGRTSTRAVNQDGTWRLYGTKWFTSATTAQVALALARPEGAPDGSGGLSLFLLELKDAQGLWNGIRVRRLKDKLGTKALPTAELELDGAVAIPVGELGGGVRKIAPMLNITRLHCAVGGSAAIGHGLMLARDYAASREAFGSELRDLPVHQGWIARIASVYEATLVQIFRVAELLGKMEHGGGGDELVRVLVPLTKLACARQGVWGTSELIESFGGAGYVEDTGLPRLLRDAHVQCIWEGTTSVMALDVLRALARPGAAEAFNEEIESLLRTYSHPSLDEPVRAVGDALQKLRPSIASADEPEARRVAWGMARIHQGALLCLQAGWALDKRADDRSAIAAQIYASSGLLEPPALDPKDLARLSFDR